MSKDEPRALSQLIKRKVLFLLVPLLFALYTLTDNETYSDEQRLSESKHHLAVLTALQRHPPCQRVFRCLAELTLLGFCTAFCLKVWERAVGKDMVGHLLFQIPYTMIDDDDNDVNDNDVYDNDVNDNDNDVNDNNVHDNDNNYVNDNDNNYVNDNDNYVNDNDVNDNDNDVNDNDNNVHDNDNYVNDNNVHDNDNNVHDNDNNYVHDNDNNYVNDNDNFEMTAITNTYIIEAEETFQNNSTNVNLNLRNSSPQPPSPELIFVKSLDFLILILVTLFLFTISSSAGGLYIDKTSNAKASIGLLSRLGNIAAPIFPLLLFFYATLRAFLPFATTFRKYLYTVLLYTVGAPFYEVTFRDGFIGDIFTSAVRPMQDIAFTIFYLFSGLRGWWTLRNTYEDGKGFGLETHSDIVLAPVEHSWLLHTVILPGCMISPLWWRYCQTLRQVYVEKKRWPYLGNSAKYFIAAQVAIYGVYDPNARDKVCWVGLFVIATLYQVWWDVFMDWELLVYAGTNTNAHANTNTNRHLDGGHGLFPFRLRDNRLYKSKSMYFCILLINILLRFCWTLSFIPTKYLSRKNGILIDTFSADFQCFVAPALASAEIIRRALWGLLRLELEAIKVSQQSSKSSSSLSSTTAFDEQAKSMSMQTMDLDDYDAMEMGPMSISTTRSFRSRPLTALLFGGDLVFQSDMKLASDVQIMYELCLYATIFTGLGMAFALRRDVM